MPRPSEAASAAHGTAWRIWLHLASLAASSLPTDGPFRYASGGVSSRLPILPTARLHRSSPLSSAAIGSPPLDSPAVFEPLPKLEIQPRTEKTFGSPAVRALAEARDPAEH